MMGLDLVQQYSQATGVDHKCVVEHVLHECFIVVRRDLRLDSVQRVDEIAHSACA